MCVHACARAHVCVSVGPGGGSQTSTCLHTQVLPLFRYKDGSLICQAGEPGKYRIDSKYGVHTLEINR